MPTVLMAITFLATLFVPLQYAVLLGIVLSILVYVFKQSNNVVVKELVLQPQGYPVEQPAPAVVPSGKLTVLMIYGSLFFAGARSVEDRLPEVGEAEHAVVALLLRGKLEISSTFMGVLQRYTKALHARGCRLMLVGVEESAYAQLAKTGVLQLIGQEQRFSGGAADRRRPERCDRSCAAGARSRLARSITLCPPRAHRRVMTFELAPAQQLPKPCGACPAACPRLRL